MTPITPDEEIQTRHERTVSNDEVRNISDRLIDVLGIPAAFRSHYKKGYDKGYADGIKKGKQDDPRP